MIDPSSIAGTAIPAIIGGAIVAYVKSRVPMRAQNIAHDENVLAVHLKRIEALEDQANKDRDQHREDMRDLQKQHAKEIAAISAELRTARHKTNNIDAAFRYLVITIKNNPDNARAAADEAMAMRTEDEKKEAIETGAILGAKITAASQGPAE